MKLLRLKLNEEFRSLPAGFEIHFLRDWEFDQMQEFGPYCLAGRNGSGKSNVMEALAAIFYHLDCMNLNNLPENFEANEEEGIDGFMAAKSIPDAFELEYLLPVPLSTQIGRVVIKKLSEHAPTIEWYKNKETKDFEDLSLRPKKERKTILPDIIVGYSSGENEVLSLPFFKMRFLNFDEYKDSLTKDEIYILAKNEQPEGRLVYLDNQFSQAIILCTMLLPNEKTLDIFEDVIQIKKIEEFRIIIKRYKVDAHFEVLQSLSEIERQDENKAKRLITGKLENVIQDLRSCATCSYEEDDTLTLDYFVNEATREAFRHHFKDALNLFKGFQMLLTINLYSVSEQAKKDLYRSESLYANETVPVLASDERVMRFKEVFIRKEGVAEPILLKSLSDGEHQFLHTIGLCLLFRDENALFLLDEPETHLNPDWRAKYVSILRNCLDGSKGMRDILLTSHSPFVVSDCQQEKVLVFERIRDEETGRAFAECKRPAFETFGASMNLLTESIFGKLESIGDISYQLLKDLQDSVKTQKDIERVKDELLKFAESPEKFEVYNFLTKKKRELDREPL